MASKSWQAFCSEKESGCPKVTRQIGRYDTEQAALQGLKHHLKNSNYHYMEEPIVIHNMGEFIAHDDNVDMVATLTPGMPSSSVPRPPPAPPAPLRQQSPHNLLRIVAPTCKTDLARRPVSPTRTGGARRTRSRSRTRDGFVCMPVEHYNTITKSMERSEEALRAAARVAQAASATWTTEADSLRVMRNAMMANVD